ncbi:MAG: methionine--tRNA ligase [Myxococcota bacterium]|jgi:methionyl-tRNA synthetase|nr:methionine--tRNA ligase [Myxococcota bacterium]
MPRPILITSALPYANGSIHLGHLVEYLQTDIYVRFLRMRGEDVRYVCADDTHGTPIMLAAAKAGVTPEEFIGRWHLEHQKDFEDFDIRFDHYSTTHSPENRRHAHHIFEQLRAKGYLEKRPVEQTYCPHEQMFLPDRFVRGSCPRCGAADQYGDSCEVCSATYEPTDLQDARCALCGTPPERRVSEHWFVRLALFREFLDRWTSAPGRLQDYVRNYVQRWIAEGLKDWDITRDAPYFGFHVPGEEQLFLYVWMDAPIGYIAATEQLCHRTGQDFDQYWRQRDGARIFHFIGKDIIYFHTLFWPAMLEAAGYNLPEEIYVHGFLTIEGRKMSKSRGTFLRARTWLDHLDAGYLRFYYASKLTAAVEDLDLSFEELANRVNAELVNKVVNLASRSLQFISKRLDGRLGPPPVDDARAARLLAGLPALARRVAGHYQAREFSRAVREIVTLAEEANLYLQQAAPWEVQKRDPEQARGICAVGVNLSRAIATMLKPVLPRYARTIEELLGLGEQTWDDVGTNLWEGQVGSFERLLDRLDPAALERVRQDALAEQHGAGAEKETQAMSEQETYTVDPLADEVDIDGFTRSDLRVALVQAAEIVPDMKKLLRLRVSLGPLGERTIFAGIRKTFAPESLVGKKLICVANLKPRTMKCGVSEGMILATGPDEEHLVLPELPATARPGDRLR